MTHFLNLPRGFLLYTHFHHAVHRTCVLGYHKARHSMSLIVTCLPSAFGKYLPVFSCAFYTASICCHIRNRQELTRDVHL